MRIPQALSRQSRDDADCVLFEIVEFFSFEKPHEQSHDDKRRNERNRKVERNVLEFVGKCVNVHKKIS